MKRLTGYIGTYDSQRSFGVYRFAFDPQTGRPSAPQLFYRAKNAKCVAVWNKSLAVTQEKDGKAGVCLVDAGGRLLAEAFDETQTSCFVAQDDTFIYMANYHEGHVLIYRKGAAALQLEKKIEIAPKAGCHQVLSHENFLLVPCLFLDAIHLYDCQNDFALAGQIAFPADSGPRHGVFDKAHARLFVVSERSNELFSFRAKTGGRFELAQVDALLAPDAPAHSTAAAIRMSLDERFLYMSVRGADCIVVFRIDGGLPVFVERVSCGGSHPRDFLLTPEGGWLLVANRTTNELVSFRLRQETGQLEEVCGRAIVAEGVGIALAGALSE